MSGYERKYALSLIKLALSVLFLSLLVVSCGELEDEIDMTISGNVTNTATSAVLSDIRIDLTGTMDGNARTDSSGIYTFGGLVPGTYNVIPLDSDYTFNPVEITVYTETSVLDIDFTATLK